MKWRGFLGQTICTLCAGPALACDIALMLAVDVSASVYPSEYRVQMDGLVAALRDGTVAEALVRGNSAVALMQWSGSGRQRVTIPWVQIESYEDVEDLALRIESDPRVWRSYSTAIGEALSVARATFAEAPDCKRRVIDVSGDGKSNEGPEPRLQQAALIADGITVNGLVIETDDKGLTDYFWKNVITGPGAFVVTANGFSDYPKRIREKLLRETTKQLAQNSEAMRFWVALPLQ